MDSNSHTVRQNKEILVTVANEDSNLVLFLANKQGVIFQCVPFLSRRNSPCDHPKEFFTHIAQYCQLHFSCATRNELDNLEMWSSCAH